MMSVPISASIISFFILFVQISIPITIIYLLYKIYRKLEMLEKYKKKEKEV